MAWNCDQAVEVDPEVVAVVVVVVEGSERIDGDDDDDDYYYYDYDDEAVVDIVVVVVVVVADDENARVCVVARAIEIDLIASFRQPSATIEQPSVDNRSWCKEVELLRRPE